MSHWKQRETVFAEYELGLTLPGRWQLRPSDSPSRWLYRSAEKHRENLTIMREDPGGVEGDEEATLRRFVARQRRAMELGFGRAADLTMSEPEHDERTGVSITSYQGTAPQAEHHFHVLFLFPPRTLWTLVYDAYRLTEEQAEAHSRAIFDSAFLR